MKKYTSARQIILFAVAFVLSASASFAVEKDRDRRESRDLREEREEREERMGHDESWQIEQRQKWFIESRGLKKVKNARELRQKAVIELREKKRSARSKMLAAGETWTEMGPSAMQMGTWSMGRVAGRLNAITVHPSNENIVYVGSAAGGVWKTADGGSTWSAIFDQTGTLPIGSVFLQSDDANKIWVGTGDKNGGTCADYFGQGVFFSADGGATWQAKNGSGATSMPLSIVNSVATNPNNSNVVLAGGFGSCDSGGTLSNAGIFRSSDAGATWTKVLTGRVEDIVFAPASSTAYATVQSDGVYKTTDGGSTWTKSISGMTVASGRMRIAMAPTDSNILYVLMGSSLYRSTNGAASWSLRNSSACEGQCTYNQAIAVSPSNSDTILVGSIRFAKSTNGGTSLSYLTGQWGSAQKVHQDTHVLTYSRSNINRFWVGSDGGIWRSDDGGTNYTNMNANLNITQFYDVAIDAVNPDTIFGGAQDNSSSGRTTSKVWNLTYASGDGFMNVVDPSNSTTVLQTSYPSGSYPSIVRSMQSGAPDTFTDLPTTGLQAGNFPWVTPLAAAGSKVWVASDRVYFGTTSANSFSWTSFGSALDSVVSVISPVQNGSVYPTYVGTSGGKIYFSSNAAVSGGSWTNVTGNYPGGRVSDIAFDKSNTQRVFVTRAAFGSNRLYRSTSGGTTWSAVGNGLPNVPANAVALDPSNLTRVFVGTDVGMYVSEDNGDNFTPFSEGLPLGLVVTDLEIVANPHALVAGTYGRGAWKVNLASSGGNVPPTANYTFTTSQLTATFTDTSTDSDGTIASRSWNFGDGSSSTLANPSHTYAAAGSYTVSLQVTDNGGATASINKTVVVGSNTPPVANFTFTTSQLIANFTDTSTDSDGSIASRSWNFGDSTSATTANPSHTYASAGTYNVTLTVTDNAGATANTTKAVTVTSSACAGSVINGSFSGATGQTQYQPNGTYYQSTVSGMHKACLSGPNGTDFDLYLDKWNGSTWANVAKSEGSTSVESISYSGTSGFYMYRVVNYSGTGSYTFTYSKP